MRWLDGIIDGHEFEQAPRVFDGQGSLAWCSLRGHGESDMTQWLNWTELDGLVVFSTSFNVACILQQGADDQSHSQLQVLFWLTVKSFSIFGCKEYNQSDFGIDHLVMSTCRVVSCVVGKGCLLWPICSLDKTVRLGPASFCIPRPNLPVTPSISWFPTFAF